MVTLNLVPGDGVYGEKRISIEDTTQAGDKSKTEYRVWNPFRSKLAAAVLGGVDKIHMMPGSKVLYLGAASGTSVSHVSDIVGPVSEIFNFCNFSRQTEVVSNQTVVNHRIFTNFLHFFKS